MMKRFTYLLLATTLVFASCSDDKKNQEPPKPRPYESGIFYYGTSQEDLAFYDPAKDKFYEGNIFENVNGEMVGIDDWSGGINDVYVYNGKTYILTPTTSETGVNEGLARIAVTDSKTLKLEKSIYADGFDMGTLNNIYSFVVVNENKFYISHNTPNYSVGTNESGVGMLEVDGNGNTTFTQYIEGTYGELGTDGPAMFQRMLRHNNYVVVPCGTKLLFVDTATDQVEETININNDNRQIADVVKGRDGFIYALVGGEIDKTPSMMGWPWYTFDYESEASMLKIDPVTLSIVREVELLDDGDQLDIKAGAEANGAVASLTSDEIIFASGMPGMATQVWAYNYITETTRLVADVDRAAADRWTVTKYMATDKKGNVYLPLQKPNNYSNISIEVYKIEGEDDRNSAVEAKFPATLPGDGGLVSTYIF